MPTKKQIIATTRCFLSASLTSQSIIEQHPAAHDYKLTGCDSALDDGYIALMKIDVDRARHEGPRLDFDECSIAVVRHHQCSRRHRHHCLRRREKAHIGKHVGL